MKDSIYVIYSESYRLLYDEINKITKNNSYSLYNALEDNLDDILDNASYMSLFSEKNYMVVKNVSNFSSKRKTDDNEDSVSKSDDVLLKYLESPNDSTVLILILKDKLNGTKKISKIVKEKYNYIEIINPNQKDIKIVVNNYLKKNKIKVSNEDISYIISSLDNNYDLVMNELDKLILYGKKEYSSKDISNIIAVNLLDNNFKFIDAIIAKDIKTVFRYYDDFLINKGNIIMIMSMIVNDYRNTLIVKKLLNRMSKNEIMSILKLKFLFQVDRLINNSFLFKEKELEDNLIYLCDLDYKIKQGKITDKLALELFLLKACK